MMKVSIIIPVKPGGEVRALAPLRMTDYPYDSYEILVAEGKCPSRQRNQAADMAGGEVLYFLDDDSLVAPGFLRRATAYYEASSIAAVGGPSLTPPDNGIMQQAFGLALASPFGGGGVRHRYRKWGGARETGDHELILCNLSMRASDFRAAGGFDRRLYPNEENELLVRMKRKGLTLIHDPDLAVFRSQRPNFGAFVRQLFGYGRGRAQQILLGGGSGIVNFVPAVFLLYLLSLPFADKPVYYLPLLCYLGISLFFTVYALIETGKTAPALILPAVFPALHLAYGAGLLWGLLRFGIVTHDSPAGDVTIRRVKGFEDADGW